MRIFLKDNKIAIKLEYGDDFKSSVEKIKTKLSPYSFDFQEKIWITEKINLLIIPELFSQHHLHLDSEIQELYKRQKKFIEELKLNKERIYSEKINSLKEIKLFNHQKQAINFMLSYTSCGLFDEQGLGKTLSTIATLCILFERKDIESAIIICPNNLKYNWKSEIDLFSSLYCTILEGSKKLKIEQLKQRNQIIITNYESLIIHNTKKKNKEKSSSQIISKQFQKEFSSIVNNNTCIILDEAHRIKNGSSSSSKYIRKLGAKTNHKYILTGTPIANHPEDIFYQFLFLDCGKLFGKNYYNFLKQYCYIGGFYFSYKEFETDPKEFVKKITYFNFTKIDAIEKLNELIDDLLFFEKWQINHPESIKEAKYLIDKCIKYKNEKSLYSHVNEIKKINRHLLRIAYKECPENKYLWSPITDRVIAGYKNLDRLRFLIGLKSIRRLKEDVLDLPEKLFQDRIIEMSKEHLKFYNDLSEKLIKIITENGDLKSIDPFIVKLVQCSSNPTLIDSNLKITSSKVSELDKLFVEHIVESKNKVILWTNYVENYPYLLERYKEYNPTFINGEVELEERHKRIKQFQESPEIKLIICNPQACKEGITLTSSCIAIYLDRDFNLVNYKQSVDRIHRIGQSKTCLIINLICKNTIDEMIMKNLFTKDVIAQYLQGDCDNLSKLSVINSRQLFEKYINEKQNKKEV